MPRSRFNEKEFSHRIPYREYFGTVLRCPTGSGVRTGGVVLARQIHATLQNPNVPLGGKLSCDSGQQHCCHRVVTATSRHAAHRQSLTATGNRRKHSENSQRQDQMNRTKADDKNLYCVAVRPRAALRKVGIHGVIGVCKRGHRTQEIRYSHSGV